MAMKQELITTEPFNWELLNPEEFENLVFFLLDDMGFKNLEWRKGGKGTSAVDGGRDLEATYAKLEPDDTLSIEKWWIEVKYRRQTLATDSIQKSVLNASGRQTVDVFAIVTSNVVSNKATDWIKEFQSQQKRPKIIIWQRHDIERIMRKYPRTVAKFFPGSLSISGRLEAVKDAFWNSTVLPRLEDVNEFWKELPNLNLDNSSLLPIVIAEASIGKLDRHQWGLVVDEKLLISTFILGIANTPQLVIRFEQYGNSNEPLIEGLSYLLQVALLRLELDTIKNVILNLNQYINSAVFSKEQMNFILGPLINNLYFDLSKHCSQDCPKADLLSKESLTAPEFYFRRFFRSRKQNQEQKPSILIQDSKSTCTLGLVPIGDFCPLFDDIPDNCTDEATITKLLRFAQKVIRERVNIHSRSDNT